jgi:hypothetical protein
MGADDRVPAPHRPECRVKEAAEMPNTDKPDPNLSARIPPPPESSRLRKNAAALERLLDGWMRGDATEQRETFEILRRSLDEDRPVGYKLFS